MKRIFLFLICFFTLAACQDDLGDRIDNLEEKVAELEKLCARTNENILSVKALVEALQSEDRVTSVELITEGGEIVGYTLHFLHGDPVEIRNGRDGAAGRMPVISAKKDADGRYYWTLDGEFLLDGNGHKIPSEGCPGVGGVTPRLKIDAGNWYISYDNGTEWSLLGAVSWDESAPLFTITLGDSEVVITVADGTEYTFPRYREVVILLTFNGQEVAEGEELLLNETHCRLECRLENASVEAVTTVSTTGGARVSYEPGSGNEGVITVEDCMQGKVGRINILVCDNGFTFTRVVDYAFVGTVFGTYTVTAESMAVKDMQTWDVTFLRDETDASKVWIECLTPGLEGSAGFYGNLNFDPQGNVTSITVPLGQVNTEIKTDTLDEKVYLFGLYDRNMTVSMEGSMTIEFYDHCNGMIFGKECGPTPGGLREDGNIAAINAILPGGKGVRKE